ncbi:MULTISPECIES: transposase [Actinosynnema]|uniref:transposase n=1 Tax=Actinosynnema TaxID=40566 RepID=UPI0020A41604|nr:transposase [Actinosynnema pretiosum]
MPELGGVVAGEDGEPFDNAGVALERSAHHAVRTSRPAGLARIWTQRLHEVLLVELHAANRIDWSHAANTPDTSALTEMLDAMPRIAGKPGRPRWRPAVLLADRGYDSQANRNALRQRRIVPLIARRGHPHGSGLGTLRWVVERTMS